MVLFLPKTSDPQRRQPQKNRQKPRHYRKSQTLHHERKVIVKMNNLAQNSRHDQSPALIFARKKNLLPER